MAVEVLMPKFGLTMQEGTIQQWFKSEGEEILAGEPLFTVETEKVLYEVESPSSGMMAKILFPADSTVPVGRLVAVIAAPGENVAEVATRYAPPEISPPVPPVQHPAVREREEPRGQERRPVTPAARKLAQEYGINLSGVTGTGPSGRITREDVERFKVQAGEVIPLRGMRKVIAERMHKSLQTSAQLTLTTEVDVTELVKRHRELQKEFAITYTDFIIHAVALALREHPRMNSVRKRETIRSFPEIHVGVAVALDEGLIVPVIRNADRKSLPEIARENKELGEKARAGTLTVDEVTGGTFTISNLGMYGVDAFTPILNPPQTGILGAGRILEKPAVHDGAITKRAMMHLSLTFDHGVIDGAPAAAFLRTVAQLLHRSMDSR